MGLNGFVEGGDDSGDAGCATHPLDLIKVRMQLHGEHIPISAAAAFRAAFAFPSLAAASISLPHPGPISVGTHILRSEGPAAFFSGVSAAVLRLALYSTTAWAFTVSSKYPGLPTPLAPSPSISRSPPGSLPVASTPPSATRPTSPKSGSIGLCRRKEQLATYDEAKEAITARGVGDRLGGGGGGSGIESDGCGIMALYKGFVLTVGRQGPFTVVLEQVAIAEGVRLLIQEESNFVKCLPTGNVFKDGATRRGI